MVLAFFAALPFHRPPITRELGPALALPELLFVCLAPLLGLALVRAGAWRSTSRTGLVLALVLLAGLGPSVMLAGDRSRALVQLVVLVYVALIHQAALGAVALGLRRSALGALVAGAAVSCTLGLVGTGLAWLNGHANQLAYAYSWTPIARPVGLTESSTMLAMIALNAGAATIALARERSLPRWQAAVLIGLFGLSLVLSQNRVLLAAAAGVAIAWAWSNGDADRPALRRASGLLAAAGIVAVLLMSLWFRLVPLKPEYPFIDTGLGIYRVPNEIAWSMFRAHPLTGVGLENFHRAWADHYDSRRHDAAYHGWTEVLRGRPLDPHGTVQGYLAEAGLPGLATVVLMAVLLVRRRQRSPEALGLLVALACALFFTDLLTERSTFATLGLLLSTSPQPRIPLHKPREPVDELGGGRTPPPGGS